MKKGKYVTLKIENLPDSYLDKIYITHDIYFKDKEGHTYIGEFVDRKNALLFCKVKNKEEEMKIKEVLLRNIVGKASAERLAKKGVIKIVVDDLNCGKYMIVAEIPAY